MELENPRWSAGDQRLIVEFLKSALPLLQFIKQLYESYYHFTLILNPVIPSHFTDQYLDYFLTRL